MKRKNNLLFTFLVLVITTLGMTACQQTSGGGKGGLALITDGTANMEIVYAESNNDAVAKATKIIQSSTKDAGKKLKAVSETDAEQKNSAYQILIGATSFKATEKAMEELKENSFSITVSGNKIVLAASNDYLYPVAAEKLVEALTSEGKTLSLAKDYAFTSDSYEALPLIADGKCDYTIVYPAGDTEASNAAAKVQSAIKQTSGAEIVVTEDSASASGKEILVGKTNRELSYKNDVYHKIALIQKDDNGNIALGGELENSVNLFNQYIEVLGANEKNVDLLDNMFGSLSSEAIGLAPLYNGSGTVEILESFEKSNSYYILVHQGTREDYTGYTTLLKEEGFELHTSSEVNGNLFETWTDGYTILTMSHIAYTDPATIDMKTESLGDISYISIAVDCIDNSALPVVETDTEDITTEQITTVGTQCAYILRLSDGRFVVFDGGMPDQAEKIYKVLQEQNEREGAPVIAAWFLTHAHQDHIGAINTFVPMYAKEIKIETFVHNLPGRDIYYGLNTWEASSSQPDKHYVEADGVFERSNMYYDNIRKSYPDSDIIVAHAGQRFEFGNIDIDVLFTTENIYRKQMYDTNMSSVCYSITGDTGRMIILGDSVDITCPMLNAIYGSSLKCNLVQVAHHGYNGGNAEMYASMDADFAIWTNSYEVVMTRGLYLKSSTPRNKFDYTSVSANIIPKMGPDDIILSEEMTADEIVQIWGDMLPIQ